jgi:signal recognition particle receptor subunit beta
MSVDHYKVLFTGPVGAGKTTAIRTISDNLPMMTDVAATDETRDRKPSTTVAMDYGVIRLGRHEVVHLYGTPGQDRFDFMWEILQEGALGLLILVDNARPDPVGDLVRFLDAYAAFITTSGVAVGITRTDLAAAPARQAYVDALAGRGLRCPVFAVDARDHRDVSLLLQSLLYCLDPEASPT